MAEGTGADGMVVSSRHNPRFRAALALRDARERRERGRLLVDGAREIGRALDAGLRPVEVWVAPDRVRSDEARALLPRLGRGGAELIETTPELFARLAYGERDDGVVSVFAQPSTDLARLDLSDRALVAVVEGLEKPGNLGAIVRSADGAGADAVIVTDPVVDVWNPNAIRASLGTILSLPLAVCAAVDAVDFLRERGIGIVAARVDAPTDFDHIDLTGPVAIVVGSEAEGLGDPWRASDVAAIRIPMLGLADSLNASTTAAILLYEARRQRRAVSREA
jgi:TrmH family RNA methyltransferase